MGLDPGFGGAGDPPSLDLGLFAELLSFIVAVYNLLVQVAVFLFHLILALIQVLVTIFSKLIKALVFIWENYVKKFVSWIASHIAKVRDWLKRVVGPVLRWFQKLKHWYDTHILPQQLRLIRMIQTIRRFLGILRLFHIKWAAKLDSALADVQNRIAKEIAITRGILNQIINTLSLVLDPTLIIRRNALGASLLSMVGAVKRIFGYGSNRPLTQKEQDTIDHNRTRYYKSNVAEHLRVISLTGPTDEDLAMRVAARQALENATGEPLPF